MTTKTLPDSTTAAYYYNGSGVTLVNAGVQGLPGASGINFGFVVAGNNDTLINNGTVYGQRVGVYLTGSGDSVINAAGKNITATEQGQAGVNFYNYSGTITNYGTISGFANAANGAGGNAVELRHGGLVTNFGTMLNGGALFRDALGTVVNTGVILGNAAYGGVYMEAGGSVTNLAGGVISANGATESYNGAPPYGVFVHGAAGTVTNAGTIDGNTGNAVLLATGFQNRVIVDPGAVFVGTVNGGTAVDATLELASGASQGTLSGIGSQYINFGTLAFDPSASWLVNASTSIASATITGFGASDTIDLAGFVAVSDTFSANTLVLTNAGNAHVTLHVQGIFTTANFSIAGDGDGGTDLGFTTASSALVYGQTIDEAGIVATSETVSAGTLTLFDAGGTVVGTAAVGTSLTSSDFSLTSDGSGGTDVIVSTVFGTYSSGVTLLTNPTTIAGAAQVANAAASGNAVAGPAGTTWTLTNLGTVKATGTLGYGIQVDGGTVTNLGAAALIEGQGGIKLAANGTVTNAGMIASTLGTAGVAVKFGTGTNRLIVDPGAVFIGTVSAAGTTTLELASTASAGTLSGLGVQYVGFAAVTIDSGAQWTLAGYNTLASGITLTDSGALTDSGTFTNAGLVTGAATGILLTTGAYLTNQSGGTITGTGTIGVSASGAATVVNAGSIGANSENFGYGISLDAGGSITNQTSGTITGGYSGIYVANAAGTISNAGHIIGTSGAAVVLSTGSVANLSGGIITGVAEGIQIGVGGFVTNASGGSITGYRGVYGSNGPLTVVNAGYISGTGDAGADAGVFLSGGGTVSNASGGTIAGDYYGVHVSDGTVINAGYIAGTNASGVRLDSGGSVTNQSGGTITGLFVSVYVSDGTVTNAGTIESNPDGAGNAVKFAGGTNRLIDDPGAVFIGVINGGSSHSAVMELASAASAGTIAGFGTFITNFGSLVFDAGAQWTVTGNDSASGLGTLGISGFTVGDTIDLTNFAANNKTFASNALVLSDGVGDYETLAISGTFVTDQFHLRGDGSGGTDITMLVSPVIGGTAAGQTTTDEATVEPFSAATITDANGSESESVTITVTSDDIASDADGTLSGTGLIKTGTGTYELSASDAAALTTELQALVFTPTEHQVAPGSTVTTGFTIQDTDLDGLTASDSTTTVIATAVNDPPTITLSSVTVGVPNEAGNTPFAAMTINDPDVGHTDTVTVTLSDPTGGTLANTAFDNLGNPTSGSDGYTSDGALLLGDSFTDGTPGAVSISLLLSASNPASGGSVQVFLSPDDGSGDANGVAGNATMVTNPSSGVLVDTIADSALTTTPSLITFSTTLTLSTLDQEYWVVLEPSTSSTTNWWYDDGTPAPGTANQETVSNWTSPVGGPYYFADTSGTYKMNVSTPDLDGGSFDAVTGVYSVSGTANAVTTALDGLQFTPAAPASGYLRTTSFTVAVTGPGGNASNDAISVTAVDQVLGLATTSGGNDVISVSPDGTGFPAATGGKTNQAVVTDPSSSTTYTLPSGYQAEFLGGTAGATLTDPSVGSALLVGNSGADLITTLADNDTILGGGGADTLSATGSNEVILGGNGNNSISATGSGTITGGTGTNTFLITAVGGTDVTSNGVDDLVNLISGAVSVSVSSVSSGTKILTGFASVSAAIAGSNATLEGGTGTLNVTTGGSNAFVIGDTGALTDADAGTHDTIFAGAASSATISGSGKDGLLLGGTGDLVASLGGGTETSNTLIGGSGLNTLAAGGTDDLIAAGAGSTTVNAAGFDNVILGGSGSLAVDDSGDDDGNIIAAFGALAPSVTLGGSGALAWGGSNTFTVLANNLQDTVLGGTGLTNVSIVGGLGENSSNVVLGGSGGLTVDDQDGQADTVAAFGASSAGVTLGGSKNIAFGGSGGNLTASVGGSDNVVVGAGGSFATSVSLTAGASGAAVVGGTGILTVDDLGTSDVIGAFGASSANVTLGGANAVLFGGSGSVTAAVGGSGNLLVGGSGSNVVTVTGSSDTILAGSGPMTVDGSTSSGLVVDASASNLDFVGGSSGSTIFGSSGAVSINGGSGGETLFGAAGINADFTGSTAGLLFVAGSGSETLNAAGSSSSNVLVAGTGADTIIGGTGNDTMVGGTGSASLVGSSGSSQDWFIFMQANAGGQDTIANFTDTDKAWLAGYGSSAAGAAVAGATAVAGGTTITLTGGTTITFASLTVAEVQTDFTAGRIFSS